MKAGLIEIADVFVVNKSDRDGAGRLAQSLKVFSMHLQKGKLEPPVFSTSADRNEGIGELYNGLNEFIQVMEDEGLMAQKQLDRHRKRVFNLVQDRLLQGVLDSGKIEQTGRIHS